MNGPRRRAPASPPPPRSVPGSRADVRAGAGAGATALALALLLTGAGPALTGCARAKEMRSRAGALAASARHRPRGAEEAQAGPVSVDGAGRTVTTVTVTNRGNRPADYTVWVDFRDGTGTLLDVVVLDVTGVGPGETRTGEARSARPLDAVARAEAAQALRH